MSDSPADKAKAAIAAAQAQLSMAAAIASAKAAKAEQEKQQAASAQVAEAAAKVAQWKKVEITIEEALEHAGISGIDAQIDENGFTRLVGQVASDADRQTAISMAEQFQVTGLDVQLEVVPAAADTEAATVAPTDAPVSYKVKAGESWWGIAQRVYGDGQLWKSLKAANNNPKMIHPGTEIILPPKSTLSR